MTTSDFDAVLASFKPMADVTAINTLADQEKCVMLRLDQLKPYPGNRVLDEDHVESMAELLRLQGQLQPLLVRPIEGETDTYEICSGHYRFAGQKLNAKLYPNEPSYRLLKAVVKSMADAEMAVNVLVSNFTKPMSIEERAQMLTSLGNKVPAMRKENPEKYSGVPTGQIIADIINENGGSTSCATVNRQLKAARDAKAADRESYKLASCWKEEDSRLNKSILLKLASLDPQTQKAVHDDYKSFGRRKTYLSERIACTDATDAEALMLKSTKNVLDEAERLLRIRSLGFYVDYDQLQKAQLLLNELMRLDEQED